MPNGNKNSGNDDIELLPLELRKPEEKKRKEERSEVKLFVPEMEEKSPKSSFAGKFFGSKQIQKPAVPEAKPVAESDLSVFKMQKEIPKASPPAPVFRSPPPPPPQKNVPSPIKPPASETPAPPQKIEPKRPQNSGANTNLSKPSGEKTPASRKFGITLLPEETPVSVEKTKRSKKIILIVVTAILLTLIGGGLYWALQSYQKQADLDLKKIEADLSVIGKKNKDLDSEKNQAQFFQKKLKTAGKLLENHFYWTSLFSFLERSTVGDVYFINLIGGSDGQIVLSGVAKSYAAMSRQIISFRTDEGVSKISVLSASASVDTEGNVTEINFDAKLQLKSGFFLK